MTGLVIAACVGVSVGAFLVGALAAELLVDIRNQWRRNRRGGYIR